MPSYEVISTFNCLRSITIFMIIVLKFKISYSRNWQNFSGEEQTGNIFGLVGHMALLQPLSAVAVAGKQL